MSDTPAIDDTDDVLRCACGSEEWIGGGLIEILSGRIYCAKCGADEPKPVNSSTSSPH